MRVFFLALSLVITVAFTARAADDYVPGPDSKFVAEVPHGETTRYTFDHSKIFPGTTRNYWVYVPKQYDATKPTCVMIFQDGLSWAATNVFDNLIARKEIPVMIGIFIQPGVVKAFETNSLSRYNRSYEYDGLGDNYARFLLNELLPEVAQKYNLSTDPNDRAIAGSSSGAIAAFTAAWERPEAFHRVFSSIGTYVGLRGGNIYPTLIRKTEPKPLRVFLQDGTADLNIYGGDWHLANEEMLSALEFSGYEVNHIWGDGAHNGKQATAIFPDALRWLWKDYPTPVIAGKGSKQPLMEILIPGDSWEIASDGNKFTDGPTANTAGEIFFNDSPNKRIKKIGLDGKETIFVEGQSASGLAFGPDGKLYACERDGNKITAYDPSGKREVLFDNAGCNDLAVTHGDEIYYTDDASKKVWFIDANRQRRVVDEGIAYPNGVRLTPDQSLLLVADYKGQFVYSFQILPNGSLTNKQRYFDLHLADGNMQSSADGMTVDTEGRLYVTSDLGVQICDQAGRVQGIIPKPQRGPLTAVAFGGANRNELYVACGDKLFKRKTKTTGVLSFEEAVKPTQPKL
ncbi:MAG TPA: SMP-30/gluconolactonase/LRE family protein [Verrucomicrobiae bacterium]|jgi:sugar lactone lactonase YvrE/enterochelin esterase-like enzyme|nr:SMP-30/gluconolactonase/LRE family protein [Verrucomicrobiae bacterium]